MSYLKAAMGGMIGGPIGAAIWATIAYFTGYEVGYIASVIGAIVGFGVRLGAGDEDGEFYGGLAIAIALVAILLGKLGATELVLRRELASETAKRTSVTDNDMVTAMAREIESEQVAKANQGVDGQLAQMMITNKTLSQFPPETVQKATATWNAIPAEEREQIKVQEYQDYLVRMAEVLPKARGIAVTNSFSIFDVLWVGLAGLAAFKLGSGMASDDD